MEDQDDFMREIYEESMQVRPGQKRPLNVDPDALMRLQAEAFAQNGVDPMQALKDRLKEVAGQ